MILKDYKNAIIAIGKANGNRNLGTALEMFLNNVKDAFATEDVEYYKGAEDIDFKALYPHYAEFIEQKTTFVEEWEREIGYKK